MPSCSLGGKKVKKTEQVGAFFACSSIYSGCHDTISFTNCSGGAAIAPILFNLAMRKLIHGVSAVKGIHVTAYADDITIWTGEGDHPSTDATMGHC